MTSTFINADTIADALQRWAADFEPRFAALLEPIDDVPRELVEAVRYSALAGGKRLRPFLVIRCCELNGGSAQEALPAAAAIECVHSFSLIHDDLPAMDNDDFRRGRPANHKRFDEATAILAGDALLALSFELIARWSTDPQRTTALVRELARGTGWAGMIGGQMVDLTGQSQPPSRELTEFIHLRKTARLFETGCRMGAIVAGADAGTTDAVGRYGHYLGRGFQISDDLLDVTSTAQRMGKSVAKDSPAGKQTFPSAVGIAESLQAAREAAEAAVAALQGFGEEADELRALATFVIRREH